MPAKSSEALAKKKQRKNEKRRRKAAERRAQSIPHQNLNLSSHRITKRRMMSPLPDNLSKADLRAMIADAVKNTAAMGRD